MIEAIENITIQRCLRETVGNAVYTFSVYIHDGRYYRYQNIDSTERLNQLALIAEGIRSGQRSKDFILVSSPHIGLGKIWCNGKCWEYRYNGDADVYYVNGVQYDHYGDTFEMILNGTLATTQNDHLEGLNEPI